MRIISKEIAKEPVMFGLWHLATVFLVLGFCVLICLKLRNTTAKQNKIILFATGGTLLLFEVFKEIILAYNNGTGWSYTWWTFPFQPCSVCMYVIIAAAFVKDKHTRVLEWLYAFLAFYGLFCGLSGVAIPADLFLTYRPIFVLFQSLFHHSALVLTGVYLIASRRVKINNKSFLKALAIFAAACLIAIPLDIIIYNFVTKDIFNMMYVSPYFECTLPIVSLISSKVPYPVYLVIYLFAFSLCAYIIMCAARYSEYLRKKSVKAKEAESV